MSTITRTLEHFTLLADESDGVDFPEKQVLINRIKQVLEKVLGYNGNGEIFPLRFRVRDRMSVPVEYTITRSPSSASKILINSVYAHTDKVFYPTIAITLEV